jgi:molybdate transport system substrate-binding protein
MRHLLILTLALSVIVAPRARAETITVSAAISLKEAVEDAARAYEKQGGDDRVELNVGSSGQLMAQIERGAPVDLFISAAAKQVDELLAAGKLDPTSRAVVATNQLVLVVPTDAARPPTSFDDLRDANFKRISIGHPDSVPAGQYAMQVLEKLGLREPLKQRLIYGANVRQVLSYVERGEVDAGIVYHTDALISGDKVRIIATADPAWHAPIEYPAAIVTGSRRREAAQRFFNFLRSERGQRILASHGFGAAAVKPATGPVSPSR